jgi:aspartate beta-hydroxylase
MIHDATPQPSKTKGGHMSGTTDQKNRMHRLLALGEILAGRATPVLSDSPLQRPSFYLPGLRNRAWFEPDEFPWVRELEAKAPSIRDELTAVRNSTTNDFAPYVQPDLKQPLQDRGAWNVFYFHMVGRRFEDRLRACPVTAAALEAIPRLAWQTGLSCFSEVAPGTHIRAHCGISNLTIRCHLGLLVSPRCRMRVGNETRRWEPGKCSIFDDSFEHEVWNDGELPRIVLMFDLYHPDLLDEEIVALEYMASTQGGRALAAPWLALHA